jgi:hypothetical protein
MVYLIAAGLTVVNLFWLVLNLLSLPGNWLMLGTTVLVAWWQRDAEGVGMFHPATLVTVLVLAVVGELLEFATAGVFAKRAGGSRRGSLMALFGGIIGGIAGSFIIHLPLIGTLLGACAGAFMGAVLAELTTGETTQQASRVGLAAGTGRFLGSVIKLLLGAMMWLILAVAAVWP